MTTFFAPAFALGATAAALTAGASAASATPGVYYPSCKAAVAAHAAPIYAGEPGYRLGLDRNHNGVACENDLPAGYTPHIPNTKTGPTTPPPVKTAPAPAKPTPTTTKSAPIVQAPAPSATPTKPGSGPVVQTDHVASSDDAASTSGVLALFGAAAGAGAFRVRSRKR